LRREAEGLQEKLAQIPAIDKQLADLAPAEQQVTKISAEAAEKKSQLDTLSNDISAAAVGVAAVERFRQTVVNLRSALRTATGSRVEATAWPIKGTDPLAGLRQRLLVVSQNLREAIADLEAIDVEAVCVSGALTSNKLGLEDKARSLRTQIESLQTGAGNTTRQAQQLREQRAQLLSLKQVIDELKNRLEATLKRRGAALDTLDRERQARFEARSSTVLDLNGAVGPRVRITLTREGQFDLYAAALAEALRGSGLRYTELSAALAKAISPRELLEACDTNDFEAVSEATSITRDRAARILAHLRESNMGSIATIGIEDVVNLQLLDGKEYKDVAELSTGQRCTVILPIVLRHSGRILIVDQPEDHIDNAFIVDTLIQAILARPKSSQVLFSTHNANIPVLGDANEVLQMGSNGRRGYVLTKGSLDEPRVVAAISTVMEGGLEAFERRAAFYRQHGKP
jgi:hypothetical protein